MTTELIDTGERLIPEGNTKTLTYGEHISRYLSVLNLVKNKRVLDVAAGTGYGSRLIAGNARSVSGLDYSQSAIEYARKHYPASNLTYTQGDAHSMPYSDNEFDVVVSFETIEHLSDPQAFINEVKRVLTSDGVFIVSTPNDDEFMEGNEFHVHEFDLKELTNSIKKNFSKSEFYYQGTYFAAGLFNEETFTQKNKDITRPSTVVTFGQEKSKAIFFIAVATNSKTNELPKLEQAVALADRWSTKDTQAVSDYQQAMLNEKIETISRKEQEVLEKEQECLALINELENIKKSKSWKYTGYLRSVKKKIIK